MTEQASSEPTTETQPHPLAEFDAWNLLPDVREALRKMGYEKPTPVQAETYKDVMEGADLLIQAQTGTGKTAAFGIPLCQTLDPAKKEIQALVLTPTRELAIQVSNELSEIGRGRGLRCVLVYGGVSFGNQVTEAEIGAPIVVGTPGRILDHLRRGTIDFSTTTILVLDEGDEMLSMGFERDISAIIAKLPARKQTLLFSATVPDEIRRLSQQYMNTPRVISLSETSIGAEEIEHFFYFVSGTGRPDDLCRVLEIEKPSSAIVFCNTRDETQVVANVLKRSGYDAEWLNSDLSQPERERVMERIKKGDLRFLVATDVAARGIDISNLSHVINYNFPESLDIYIHRTGRTGRIGRAGTAISLITPQDVGNFYYLRLTYHIRPVERHLPDEREMASRRGAERLEKLASELAETPEPEWFDLVRRIWATVGGDRVLAALVKRHFEQGARPSEEPKTAPAPVPVRQPRARRKKETDDAGETRRDGGRAQGSKPPSTVSPDVGTGEAEVELDAGRNDGVRISFLLGTIEDKCGLKRETVGKVIVRDSGTTLHIPASRAEEIVKALDGLTVKGKVVKAWVKGAGGP